MTFVLVLVLWLFSLCLHEYAHARVALQGGDTSVVDKGYLSLNPLRYTHPVYSIGLPLLFAAMGGIGLPGGAVYIDRARLKSPAWESMVSAAGPMTNLLIAVIVSLFLGLSDVGGTELRAALAFFAELQVTAVVFNLLPIPPFDGFGILEPHLSESARLAALKIGRFSIWIIFIALWYVEPVATAFWRLVGVISGVIGIPGELAYQGYQAFMIF